MYTFRVHLDSTYSTLSSFIRDYAPFERNKVVRRVNMLPGLR